MTTYADRALMDQVGEREPPSSIETEQALLGAVLVDNDAYRRVIETVRAEHFVEPAHRKMWSIITALVEEKGVVADRVTVAAHMDGVDLGVPVSAYLSRLCAEATPFSNVLDYARNIRDLWIRRSAIGVCGQIRDIAYDMPPDAMAEKLFAEIERRMEELRPVARTAGEFMEFSAAAGSAVVRTSAAYKRQGMLVGLSTGLPPLDDALGGLHPSDLMILAGRPGMGKTALATNIAYAAAQEVQRRRAAGERLGVIGFSSLEMSADQVSDRILSDRSNVPVFKLRKGYANEIEMERYYAADRELRGLPLMIDPSGGLSIGELRSRVRSLKKRHGLELLVIDYLQLLNAGERRGREQNRTQEVTEITGGLKALAKELDVPIIALSQLSRRVEERPDRRPMLSDLRESGSIEQDADVVMFVYREDYYLKKEAPRAGTEAYAEWERRLHQATGVAQVILGKNRHGPEQTITLGFHADFTRFIPEPEPRDEMPAPERQPRAKKITLPKEALIALGVLRGLNIAHTVENTGDLPRVPRGVRPVDYLLWREKCAEQLLDPGFDEKEAISLMKAKVVPALLEADLICRGGSKEQAYVWLTDRGQA